LADLLGIDNGPPFEKLGGGLCIQRVWRCSPRGVRAIMYWMKTGFLILWISAALAVPHVALAQGGHASSRGVAPHAAPKSAPRTEVRRSIAPLTDAQTEIDLQAYREDVEKFLADFEAANKKLKESAHFSSDDAKSTGEVSRSTDSIGPIERAAVTE
jgi:hypothetical protein